MCFDFVYIVRMPSINGKMDSEEEDMDQDTPDSDKSDSRSSHSGTGSDEEESSGMKHDMSENIPGTIVVYGARCYFP